MQVTAKLKYLRIAPRKVRLVADMIRGKDVETARVLLRFALKKSTGPIGKLLDSAVANAKNNFDLDEKNLRITKINVDEGPKLKRWRPRSRGRAMSIQKKTSHINLVLEPMKSPSSAKSGSKTNKDSLNKKSVRRASLSESKAVKK